MWYNLDMNKIELAYTAGIIDGEGWISIKNRQIKNGYRNYCLKVGVASTNEPIINWLKGNYGGSICFVKSRGNRKDKWVWDLATKQASELLKLVLPYLKIKNPQAELALKFQSRRKYRGNPNWLHPGIRSMTEKEFAQDNADKELMGKYNKRGVN